MTESIKVKGKKAILWSAFDKVGAQAISIVVGVVLARNLISPHDYGLIAMIGIFSAFAGVVLDSGFSSAIIRKIDCTKEDLNTVFFFNLGISLILYSALFFSAPLISEYFKQPILKPLSRLLFLTLIINSLGIIQNAVLTKNLNYKTMASINLASLVISSLTAIGLALMGYGVWALVWQALSLSIVKTILVWIKGNWWPQLIFSFQSLKELFTFSSNLLIASIFGVVSQNAYAMILGKFYTPNNVGYYYQATKWSDMFSSTLHLTITGATYPVFSTVQNDSELLLKTYRKTLRLTAFIVFPVLFGATLVGQSLINILLGSKWEQSGIYFQILCLGGVLFPFVGLNCNFILVKGDSRKFLNIEIIRSILAFSVLLISVHYGIMTVILGQIAVKTVHYIIVVLVFGKQVNYYWQMQLKDMFPYFALSVMMVAIAYPFRFLFHNDFLLLPTQIIIAALFYYYANRKLDSKILEEVVLTFKSKKS
jgi:Membrane protein involved in the export of O-antigen and teichoic acid